MMWNKICSRGGSLAASVSRRAVVRGGGEALNMVGYAAISRAFSVAKQKADVMLGTEACAYGAFGMSEMCFIYPITPASPMGDHVDTWASQGKTNCLGSPVRVLQMQSEAGAAAGCHGAASSGALTSSFTCSQGLLLMIPQMNILAAEMTPGVLHVTARTIAKHALSIFGDHSDVMQCRQTGMPMLVSGNQQEVVDMAFMAHIASLKGSLQVLHFFDGFRTSHSLQTLKLMPYETVRKELFPFDAWEENLHRKALTNPVQRGQVTDSQLFAMQMKAKPYYDNFANIVEQVFADYGRVSGRKYRIFDYIGSKKADRVIICMGTCSKTTQLAMEGLRGIGEKVGLLTVRLYRPFDTRRLIEALPSTVKKIAVLDRTNEMGAFNPLYLDVQAALASSKFSHVQLSAGVYGIASKEYTTGMAEGVYNMLKSDNPRKYFTLGINDDVSHTSIPYEVMRVSSSGQKFDSLALKAGKVEEKNKQCMLWGVGGDGTIGNSSQAIRTIVDSRETQNISIHAQLYNNYDSHKEGGATCSNLRIGGTPILAEFLCERDVDYISCGVTKFPSIIPSLLRPMKRGGTFLLNTTWTSAEDFEKNCPEAFLHKLAERQANLYVVDATKVAKEAGMAKRGGVVMQTCFYKLSGILPQDEAMQLMRDDISKRFKKKGDKVVQKNLMMVQKGEEGIKRIEYDAERWLAMDANKWPVEEKVGDMPEMDILQPGFVDDIMKPLLKMEGDALPVSVFEKGGLQPVSTAKFEKRGMAREIPVWEPEKCIQCNVCMTVCPHAVIRPFLLSNEEAEAAPEGFKTIDIALTAQQRLKQPELRDLQYSITISPYDCTGCELCTQPCPTGALAMENGKEVMSETTPWWDYVIQLPNRGAHLFSATTLKGAQFQTPLMEFPGACSGCGESPFIKLVSQMYGPQAVIANSSGCSSVWLGTAASNPLTVDDRGYGPAWARSLFEDAATFGLSVREGSRSRRESLTLTIADVLQQKDASGVTAEMQKLLQAWMNTKDSFEANDRWSSQIEEKLSFENQENPFVRQIALQKGVLRPHMNFIFGGDGWAFDIGFGGLYHTLSTGKNVNAVVMDTEMYANTGAQISGSTNLSAVHKFAQRGKRTKKKDMGRMFQSLGNVYVASVCLGANMGQAVSAVREACSYDGPSLILAFTPCVDWGLDPSETLRAQKEAVDTGYYNLWRYNPQKANPLTIDSIPRPNADVLEFLSKQNRFQQLKRLDANLAEDLHSKYEATNYRDYSRTVSRSHGQNSQAGDLANHHWATALSREARKPVAATQNAPFSTDAKRQFSTVSSSSSSYGFGSPLQSRGFAAGEQVKEKTGPLISGEGIQFFGDGKVEDRPRGSYVNRPRPVWNALKCTQCLECVSACDQQALYPFWLTGEQVDAAKAAGVEMNVAPANDDDSKFFTFVATNNCNGCNDCVERCDEFVYGPCLSMMDDPAREWEAKDAKRFAFASGVPEWNPDTCTACGKCVTSCPVDGFIATELSPLQLQATPLDVLSRQGKVNAENRFVLSVKPDTCVSCQECVAECNEETGGNSALKLAYGPDVKAAQREMVSFLEEAQGAYKTNEIIKRKVLGKNSSGQEIVKHTFYNPLLAKKAQAGHFAIVQSHDDAERIPLSYVEWNSISGLISIITSEQGASTKRISGLEKGQKFASVLGPLGMPSELKKHDGKVLVVTGGAGIASTYAIINDHKNKFNNDVVSILGFRNGQDAFLVDEVGQMSSEMLVFTDDGSLGRKGRVAAGVEEVLGRGGDNVSEIYVCGSPLMMESVVEIAEKHNVPVKVSAAPVMLDGTGLCGSCRVEVRDEKGDWFQRFGCIHGPDFDGTKLNWDLFKSRHAMYYPQEHVNRSRAEKIEHPENIAPAHSRVPMRELPGMERGFTFDEAMLGYSREEAIAEAKRCIQCKTPTCMKPPADPSAGCPVDVNIPGFIKQIAEGNFVAASQIIKRTNALPAVCGRICPQENQCESECIFMKDGEVQPPIAIGRLERFCADYERHYGGRQEIELPPRKGKSVAVVGSGPASIACAGDLSKWGYDVTILEKLHKPGGVLMYGIPSFRLPKDVLEHEFLELERWGVKTKLNYNVGPLTSVPELMKEEGFDAVFLGIGAGSPAFPGIPGENTSGVMSANEFLARVNMMKVYAGDAWTPVFGDKASGKRNIIVIGAGSTAFDVARCALRLVNHTGGKVTMVYRRAMSEAPSRAEEVHHAGDEGLNYAELRSPVRVLSDERGHVKGLEVRKMEQTDDYGKKGELRSQGSGQEKKSRRKVREIPDSEEVIECDVIIPAIGTSANEVILRSFQNLSVNKRGYIMADDGMHTNVPGIFAGGDIVSGAATVIEAAGMGKTGAKSIHKYFESGEWPETAPQPRKEL